MFKNILVPVDGSSPSKHAVEVAVMLAKDQQAKLQLIHVVDETVIPGGLDGTNLPPDYIEKELARRHEIGRKVLDRAESALAGTGVDATVSISGRTLSSVADTILEQAQRTGADLIVLGTHGRRGLTRVLMGSDAELVMREAKVPVLLVHAKSDPA